ncbi:MAG: glycosyl transferase [Deltaproteobacteria bacterium]|nr:glycosyl transferase [Deltaproteobacteria bacterium]
MSDFLQRGPITTLHILRERDPESIEAEIASRARLRPIALVLPSLISEMDSPALAGILDVLKEVDYLSEIVVTLGPAGPEEFQRALKYFQPLQKEERKVRLIWNDGERINSLYREMDEQGLCCVTPGKGRSAWMAYGYVVAERDAYVIALHDCDIISYDRNLLSRLVYPTVMPQLNYEFCKGYYARIADRMYGRVTRLLVTPLIQALITIVGNMPVLNYFNSFRYALAGEFSMVADLARVNRIPSDWGLEVGVLAEVYRNCSVNRICQVELCQNYEHKHQTLSQEDPSKGLNKMAIDICLTFFRVLRGVGVILGEDFFGTLRVAFLEEAQTCMAMYHDDASINGLHYDRHEEAVAFEMFSEAIRIAGDIVRENPLGPPPIPNWNRVFAAIPDFDEKLVEAVELDNIGFFD